MYIIFKLMTECSQNEDIGSKEPQPPPQSLPAPRTRSNTVVSHTTSAAVLPVTSQVAAGGGHEMSIGIDVQVDASGQPARVFLHTLVTCELPQPGTQTATPPQPPSGSGTQTPTERPPTYNVCFRLVPNVPMYFSKWIDRGIHF